MLISKDVYLLIYMSLFSVHNGFHSIIITKNQHVVLSFCENVPTTETAIPVLSQNKHVNNSHYAGERNLSNIWKNK